VRTPQYKDEDVKIGVNYKVQYLGSVEIDFDPTDQDVNQESAQTAVGPALQTLVRLTYPVQSTKESFSDAVPTKSKVSSM
jgi:hypothetical protein